MTQNIYDAVKLKAKILHSGVSITETALKHYNRPYLIKKRAYGNQDPFDFWQYHIPQEIYLYEKSIVVAVNVRTTSSIKLDYADGDFFLFDVNENIKYECDFPKYPEFYDIHANEQKKLYQYITLYGGKSLATFVYGSCSLVTMEKPCHYCSIQQNRSKVTGYDDVIKPHDYEIALTKTLEHLPEHANQVMINGGNFPNLNKNFSYYVNLAKIAEKAVEKSRKKLDVHLIVYPPEDLYMLDLLKGCNFSIAMNSEIHDEKLFNKYCPGKKIIAGQKHTLNSLKKSVKILGKGRVFSIFVGGLEPIESLEKGVRELSTLGVTPVVNVFHPDPGTPLENHPSPSVSDIIEMGKMLQTVYKENSYMHPFYRECGRNSLDTESYLQLF